jgi:KaiC/GvpD/RAD55 family RecA-like ATPase
VPERYEYDYSFQSEVLHLSIRNGTFLKQTRGVLASERFSDPCHRIIAGLVLDYFDKQGRPPSQGVLNELLRTSLSGKKGSVGLTAVRRSLTDVLSAENVDPDYVGATVREFAARSQATLLLGQAQEYFETGRYEEFREELDKAFMLRHPEPAAVRYSVGVEERLASYKGGFHKVNPLPTGVEKLDNYLIGGLDRGEMGVVLGLRGTGKSHTLIHFGATALDAGKKVWHVTLEMGLHSCFRRYDQRLARMPDKELAEKAGKVAKKLKEKDLSLFWYPTNRLTVSQIRSMLSRLGKPDLLVVDYARRMRPDCAGASRWEEIADTYCALRDLAVEFDIGVWTAAQVNRQAYQKTQSEGDVITQEHLSESIGIADSADVIISFNQTRAEKDLGMARLWLDKGREGEDKKEVEVRADWRISLLQ